MRRSLDFLYDATAWLAALSMIGVLVMVLNSILGRLRGGARRALELLSLSAAVLLAGLFAFYACRLVWQSHAFNDMSTSNDATPLWIPQLAMAVGTVLLCVALVDEWVLELRGRRAHDMHSEEALHNE